MKFIVFLDFPSLCHINLNEYLMLSFQNFHSKNRDWNQNMKIPSMLQKNFEKNHRVHRGKPLFFIDFCCSVTKVDNAYHTTMDFVPLRWEMNVSELFTQWKSCRWKFSLFISEIYCQTKILFDMGCARSSAVPVDRDLTQIRS